MSPGKVPAGETIHEIPKSPSPGHSPIRSPPRSPKKDGQKSPKKGKGKSKGKVRVEELSGKAVQNDHYTDDFENGNNTQENVSSIEDDKIRESK